MIIKEEKKALRKSLLNKIFSLSLEEIKRRSENVIKILSSLPIYKEAKLIMGYYPLKGEIDILGMIRKDLNNKRFCFPVVDLEKKEIFAYEIRNLDKDFIEGPWKIKQPDPQRTKEVNLKEIDIIIVPGLAFDKKKNRLGRGAGFYDRFLKKIKPPTKKVGIAFEFQILENLPTHPTDEKVDIVVSENFLI